MRLRLFLSVFSLATSLFLLSPTPSFAISPPQKVYMNDFFPLYRFVARPYLPLNENQELSRDVVKQEVILDTRPKSCSVDCSKTDGTAPKDDSNLQACVGPVNLKLTHLDGGTTMESFEVTGTCSARCPQKDGKDNGNFTRTYGKGTCKYIQTPGNADQGVAADYSKSLSLAYPKLQNSSLSYNNVPEGAGNVLTRPNALSYGRAVITQPLLVQLERKLLTAWQAQETKAASNNGSDTGIWPLGGVDWLAPLNSQANCTASTDAADTSCTIISVWKAMNSDSDGQILQVLSGTLEKQWQEMLMPPETPSDFSGQMRVIDGIFTRTMALPVDQQPSWYKLLQGVPECGPGYDRGYVFLSHCFPLFGTNVCTPIGPLETFVSGNPTYRTQTTYADPSARETLCSSVYELYSMNTLDTAHKVMKTAKDHNPLLPFTLLANDLSFPNNIEKHLASSMNDEYGPYFNIYWFAKLLDGWRMTSTKMWHLELGYKIRGSGSVDVRQGGAYESAGLQNVFDFIVGTISESIDNAFKITHHSVYIPPLSAIIGNDVITDHQTSTTQSLDSQKLVLNADTEKYSNSVESTKPKFTGGTFMRNIEWFSNYIYTCTTSLFSALSQKNPIDAYSKGGRIACNLSDVAPSENSPGDICSVAQKYNIDCNFFKAIYAIESCSGATLPTGGSLGCCNAQGYCGPMAVGGGIVGKISPDKKRNVCMKESEGMDNFELAARWLLIKKWCAYNSATCLGSPDPYQWKDSYIEQYGNSNITTREEIESFVYGWYGTTAPDTDSQKRWGQGKSFVDAVQVYMQTGSLASMQPSACSYTPPK